MSRFQDCVVSELLATSTLITLLGVHMLLDAAGVRGAPSFNNNLDHDQRISGMRVYLVIMVFQLGGITLRSVTYTPLSS